VQVEVACPFEMQEQAIHNPDECGRMCQSQKTSGIVVLPFVSGISFITFVICH
jgi:hypothetical protein